MNEDTVINALTAMQHEFIAAECDRLDRLHLRPGTAERVRECRQFGATGEELARKLTPRMPGATPANYEAAIASVAADLEKIRPNYPRITQRGPWRVLTRRILTLQEQTAWPVRAVLASLLGRRFQEPVPICELAARLANPKETEEEFQRECAIVAAELERRRPSYPVTSQGAWDFSEAYKNGAR